MVGKTKPTPPSTKYDITPQAKPFNTGDNLMEKEHTLPSGEIMYFTSEGDHPYKPICLFCWISNP